LIGYAEVIAYERRAFPALPCSRRFTLRRLPVFPEGPMNDKERILKEAKAQGIDLSGGTDEMVAKFAYCVSERILAGETLRKAVARCLLEIRDLI
jgi:hypothetical protein